MTLTWRSTTLQLVADHCPAVLKFLEAGAPYSREVFHVGTAAHACLEDIGKATTAAGRWLDLVEAEPIAQMTCEKLIAEGRDFEGKREPPLPSAAVWQGRDLALAYQADKPLSPAWRYEETLAVTRDFLPCPVAGEPWLIARIDARGTKLPSDQWWEDEPEGGPALVVTDYKSAYSAVEDSLRTIQRKIQAVLAWAHWGDGHEELRLVVVNFRLQRDFELSIFPRTPEGAALMERWRNDIRSEIQAREGERIAAPGACCFGCPYLNQCPDALSFLPRVFGTSDPEAAAAAFAVNLAVASSMEPALRRLTDDAPIEISGGFVGSQLGTERRLTDDAPQKLVEFWLKQAKPANFEQLAAMLPGLLSGMKIGTAQAEALLKKYLRIEAEQIAEREALLASMTKPRLRPKWGAHRGDPNLLPEEGIA